MYTARAHQNTLKKRETQSRSKSVTGKVLPQPDRQMGASDERALCEEELCKINQCFLQTMDETEFNNLPAALKVRFKKTTPYAHSVHRCCFNSYHFMLLRGKDLRNTDFNLDLMNVWEMPQSKTHHVQFLVWSIMISNLMLFSTCQFAICRMEFWTDVPHTHAWLLYSFHTQYKKSWLQSICCSY